MNFYLIPSILNSIIYRNTIIDLIKYKYYKKGFFFMDKKNFKYDFFISYRHAEPDADIAAYIQRLLENYSIPKELQEKSGKSKIKRVFRDESELSASSDLSQDIRNQLAESEFLIVICSPNTRHSRWVTQEIQTFMEVRTARNILPVLIAGEPEDSFPDILMETEPMAANFRGSTKKEIRRQCDTEILRLLAPALYCSYDELKQRHKSHRMKKLAIIASIITVFAIAFSSYSIYQSVQISKNLRAKQISQSKLLAEESKTLLESGDREAALLVALEALPENESDDSRPLVGEAQLALQNALNLYTLPPQEGYFANRVFPMKDSCTSICDLDEVNRIFASCDAENQIYYWDLDKETLITTFSLKERNLECKELYIVNEHLSLICVDEKVFCFDYQENSVKWEWTIDEKYFMFDSFALSPKKDILAVGYVSGGFDENSINIIYLDTQTGKTLKTQVYDAPAKDATADIVSLIWHADNQRLCIQIAVSPGDRAYLYALNYENEVFTPINDFKYTIYAPSKIAFADDNTLIHLLSDTSGMAFNYYYSMTEYTITAYDFETNKKKWSVAEKGISRDDNIQILSADYEFESEKHKTLVTIVGYSQVVNILDGKILSKSTYGTSIAGVIKDNLLHYHITDDGIIHKVAISNGSTVNEDYGNTDLGVQEISHIYPVEDTELLVMPKQGGNIYYFNRNNDSSGTELKNSKGSYSDDTEYSNDGNYILGIIHDYENDKDTLNIWDSMSKELLLTDMIQHDDLESYQHSGFIGSEYFYYATNHHIKLYSTSTMKNICTYDYKHIDENGYIIDKMEEIVVCQTATPTIYFSTDSSKIMKISGEDLTASTVLTTEQLEQVLNFTPETDYDYIYSYNYTFLVSPDSRYIVLHWNAEEGDLNSYPIYIWDCEEKKSWKIPEMYIHNDSYITNFVFSQDSSKLLVYDNKQTLHVVDIISNNVECSFSLDGDSYHAFWISPDNRYVFLHSYNYVLSIYDLKEHTYTMTTEAFNYKITNWKYFENGNLLIEMTPHMAFPIQLLLRPIGDGQYETYASIGDSTDATLNNFLLQSNNRPITQYDSRSLNEMIEMAKEFLNGRELTELERQRYHVDE